MSKWTMDILCVHASECLFVQMSYLDTVHQIAAQTILKISFHSNVFISRKPAQIAVLAMIERKKCINRGMLVIFSLPASVL